jgi:hypothetical protein
MLLRDLAFLGYGHPDTSPVGKLLRSAGRSGMFLSAYDDYDRKLLRQGFQLHESDSRAAFATWGDVLIVGMRGQTAYARKLQAYLLRAERENRIRWTIEGRDWSAPCKES